jgi:hypothetical protein
MGIKCPPLVERVINHHPLAAIFPGPGIRKARAFASTATNQIGEQKDKNIQSCSEYVWN